MRCLCGLRSAPTSVTKLCVWGEEWRAFSPDRQRQMLRHAPGLIANLDGIPAAVRSPANLDRIQSERARLQDDSVRISQELHREFFGGRLSNTGAGQWYAERKLEDLDALDELFRAEPDRRLLLMDMRSGGTRLRCNCGR